MRQGASVLHPPIIFQAVDQLPYRAFEHGRGACGSETRRPDDASTAEMVFISRTLERDSTSYTLGRADKFASLLAFQAEVNLIGIGDEPFAKMTMRRENDVKKRLEHS